VRALPSVSVCIPVYRGEQFLARRCAAVLDQTHRDFELVMLDNASPDATARIARSFGDPRIRSRPTRRHLRSRRTGGRRAPVPRPLIKLVCADDLLHPRCLEYQVGPMEADPGLAVRRRPPAHDRRAQPRARPPPRPDRLTGVRSSVEVARRVVRNGANPIGEPGGVLFRREHYFAAGGWRPGGGSSWTSTCGSGCCSTGVPRPSRGPRRVPHRQESLSADNEATIYAEQKAYIEELGATPHLQSRRTDLLLGRTRAPLGGCAAARCSACPPGGPRDERLAHVRRLSPSRDPPTGQVTPRSCRTSFCS
jgi:glycosyltransferase involved in cell wall biosynthesis